MNFTYLLGSLYGLNEIMYVKGIEPGFRATHPCSSPNSGLSELYIQESIPNGK